MCGRIVQKTNLGILVASLGMDDSGIEYIPRYNLAPGAKVLALRLDQPVSLLKWGLLPTWAKDPKIAYSLSNARSETISEKPSFRSAFRSRRCLIPIDGFYEWKKEGKQKKPYFIHRADEEVFYLAGLWESWKSPESVQIETVTIITRQANDSMRSIHDRMPVTVLRDQIPLWFDTKAGPEVFSTLVPLNPSETLLTPVDPRVNNARVDDADCIKAITN